MKTLTLILLVTVLITTTVSAEGQIDISYAGYTISQPGSYIVVKDLFATTDQNAITIQTSNVTINLNGHTLYGAGTTTGSTGDGIFASFTHNNITVTNGIIRNFLDDGIELQGNNHQIIRVKLIQNGSRALDLTAGDYHTILENITQGNIQGGIFAGDGCILMGNICGSNSSNGLGAGSGSTIIGNTVYQSGFQGITGGIGSTIKDNTTYDNTFTGIGASAGCQIVGNTSYSNGIGIWTSTSQGCAIESNVLYSNTTAIYCEAASNYIAGNRLRSNTFGIVTVAGNTLGDGSNGFLNIVIPYAQPNILIQQFSGFCFPEINEQQQAVIRNVKW